MGGPSYRDADASRGGSSQQGGIDQLGFLKNERERVGFIKTWVTLMNAKIVKSHDYHLHIGVFSIANASGGISYKTIIAGW